MKNIHLPAILTMMAMNSTHQELDRAYYSVKRKSTLSRKDQAKRKSRNKMRKKSRGK